MDENIKDILDQDTWLPATPDITKDGYIKIDLNKVDLVTYSFNKRFRQGENGPQLKLWFYDGNQPHQLDKDNSSVTLYGLDAGDKIKVISADQSDTWQAGRVVIALSSQAMATAGQYKRCVIEVKNKDQVIATINFNLDVLPNDFYNLNIGSDPFSSQVDEKVKNTINYFNDISKEATDKYDGLKQAIDNITDQIAKNNIVTKDIFDNKVTSIENNIKDIEPKRFDVSSIAWKDPFSSYTGFGQTSLSMIGDEVLLSISTNSYNSSSAIICTLPSEARPIAEKVGHGISMDGDGHGAQPVLVSILTNGDVVVQNNTHDHAKIVLTTTYNVKDPDLGGSGNNSNTGGNDNSGSNTGGNTGNTGNSAVTDISDVSAATSVALPNSVVAYRGDGSVSRTLPAFTDYISTKWGHLNGDEVNNVSTDEWVYSDKVNKISSYTAGQKPVTPTTTTPRLYDQYGRETHNSLTIQAYSVDKVLHLINGRMAWEISTNAFIDSEDCK